MNSRLETEQETVKQLRESLGLSLRDFAGPLGVSHNAVRQWEMGICKVDPSYLPIWFKSETPYVILLAEKIKAVKLSSLREEMRILRADPA